MKAGTGERTEGHPCGRVNGRLTAGVTVRGEGPLVKRSWGGGARADGTLAGLVREVWGEAPVASGDRPIGKGRLLWGGGLATTLVKLGIAPDVNGAQPSDWCHPRARPAEVYFGAAGLGGRRWRQGDNQRRWRGRQAPTPGRSGEVVPALVEVEMAISRLTSPLSAWVRLPPCCP